MKKVVFSSMAIQKDNLYHKCSYHNTFNEAVGAAKKCEKESGNKHEVWETIIEVIVHKI